jgi:hypothetical protein
MRAVDVTQLVTKGGAIYSPDFDAILGICFSQRLFGFGSPRTLWDGTGSNSDRSIGPIKS